MSLFSDHHVLGIIENIKDPPISLFAVGSEAVADKSYYFNNKERALAYLFQYTLEGSGSVKTNGEVHRVKAGNAFFLKLSGESEYYFDEKKDEGPWTFLYVIISGERTGDYYDFLTGMFGNVYTLPTSSPSISALSEMYRMAKNEQINDSFTAERLAFDFLCKLCTDCTNNKNEYIKIVSEAIDIITKEYSTLDGIAEIAERLGVTQSYLSRIFAAQTGLSPIKYLTKVRLQNATNLLVQTSLSIEDISRTCGFSCGNYFCKAFRNYMGISPLKYRNKTINIFSHK